jgi:magnesium-transporting ATPase (P-type)
MKNDKSFDITKEEIQEMLNSYLTSDIVDHLKYMKDSIKSTEDLAKKLKVDLTTGLDLYPRDEAERLVAFGDDNKVNFFGLVKDAFTDITTIILMIIILIKIFVNRDELMNGIWLILIISIIVIINAYINFQKENSFKSMLSSNFKEINVLRNGKTKKINFNILLIGDIIPIQQGDT